MTGLRGLGYASGMGGQLLHGVEYVEVLVLGTDDVIENVYTDGRVFLWSSGAITIYPDDRDKPWQIIQAHRVHAIHGGEHG